MKSGRNVWIVTDGRGHVAAIRDCEAPGFPPDVNVMRTFAADKLPDETLETFHPWLGFVPDAAKIEAKLHREVLEAAEMPDNRLRIALGLISDADKAALIAALAAKDKR